MLYLHFMQVTTRQKELLAIIYGYIKDTGFPPTIGEMREQLGVVSNQSIIDLLGKLRDKGLIKRNEGSARNIAILPMGYGALEKPSLVPFLGIAAAGFPIEAIEISGEWQQVSQDVAKLDANIFMLRISGDSMINAGIDDGDAVLVQTKKEFISGEIVYAQIGDEGTIKRFMSDDKPPYVYLKPENPKYELIPFTHEMELKGKIISVLKNNYWQSVK